MSFEGSYFTAHDWEIGPTIATLLPHYRDTLQKLTLGMVYLLIDIKFKHPAINPVQNCRFFNCILYEKTTSKVWRFIGYRSHSIDVPCYSVYAAISYYSREIVALSHLSHLPSEFRFSRNQTAPFR